MYRNITTWAVAFVCSLAVFAMPANAEKKLAPESVAGATTIDNATAHSMHASGATFIDVRSQMMWDAGRIPGASFLPSTQFTKDALVEIAKSDQDIVIYCQGKKCMRSSETAKKAVSWGYGKVFYYRDGFPGWKSAGYEVE
jgi:rhodanese-related sulfurtransferase